MNGCFKASKPVLVRMISSQEQKQIEMSLVSFFLLVYEMSVCCVPV